MGRAKRACQLDISRAGGAPVLALGIFVALFHHNNAVIMLTGDISGHLSYVYS